VSLEAAVAEPDNRTDAVLAVLAGRHIHAHDQDSGHVYTLSAAYGLADDLTLSASLPYVRRVAIREGTQPARPAQGSLPRSFLRQSR